MSIAKSIANKYNNPSVKFDFDSSDLDFKTLKELHDIDLKNGSKTTYTLKGIFINKKNKFGDQPVAVTNDFLTSLPTYLNDTVKEMLQDEDVITATNGNKLGFVVRSYSNNREETYYTIDWVDVV